jgi:hypothetical protein
MGVWRMWGNGRWEVACLDAFTVEVRAAHAVECGVGGRGWGGLVDEGK